MDRRPVDVVRECFEAYQRGDTQAALAAFDPRVEFDMTIRPDGQVFHGPRGVSMAMEAWASAFEELTVEAEEFLETGDRVLIIGTQAGRARGLDIKRPFFHLVTVQHGKILHWRAYAERHEALAAAGLPG